MKAPWIMLEGVEHGTSWAYHEGCRCLECRAARSAETAAYRARDPDKVREAGRRWRENYPERVKEAARKYRASRRGDLAAKEAERRKKNPEGVRAAQKKYADTDRGKRGRRERCWAAQGIVLTWEQYTTMYESQGGKCRICGRSLQKDGAGNKETGHVDHDHKTGLVRAILCYKCNQGLGLYGDDPSRLDRAAEYLREYSNGRLTPKPEV